MSPQAPVRWVLPVVTPVAAVAPVPSSASVARRLEPQLEACEEAAALRRTELAQRLQRRLEGREGLLAGHPVALAAQTLAATSEEATAFASADVSQAAMWSEELAFGPDFAFTPRTAWALTKVVRETCCDATDYSGTVPISRAVVPVGLLLRILDNAEAFFRSWGAPALVELQRLPGKRLLVVGGLRGQLQDLLWIFFKFGLPSELAGNCYFFNGDLADRDRSFGIEVLALVLCWMLAMPAAVLLNQGSLEIQNAGFSGGLYGECCAKYGARAREVFERFGRLFAVMPVCHVFGSRGTQVMVVPSGIAREPSQMLPTLRHTRARQRTALNSRGTVLRDTLWSDPQETLGLGVSSRSPVVVNYGPDVTQMFCQNEGVALVIRSHSNGPTDGLKSEHGNRLYTVFSASNYRGIRGNSGGILALSGDKLAAGRFQETVQERRFYAPPLEQVCQQKLDAPPELQDKTVLVLWSSAIGDPRDKAVAEAEVRYEELEKERQRAVDLSSRVLDVIAKLVVEHKEALFRAFWERDAGIRSRDGSRCGFVAMPVWRDVCDSVIGRGVAWDEAATTILEGLMDTSRGIVDYHRFLHRFYVRLRPNCPVREGWFDGVFGDIFAKLRSPDRPLQEILESFDRDKDGQLSIRELSEALASTGAGISPRQSRGFFLSFAALGREGCGDHRDVRISSFLSELSASAEERSASRTLQPVDSRLGGMMCLDLQEEIYRTIWLHREALLAAFHILDSGRTMRADRAALTKALSILSAHLADDLDEELPLSPAQVEALVAGVEMDSDGTVKYAEFLDAFEVLVPAPLQRHHVSTAEVSASELL